MQPRALGRKAGDEFMVPLCRIHHRALHRAVDERRLVAASRHRTGPGRAAVLERDSRNQRGKSVARPAPSPQSDSPEQIATMVSPIVAAPRALRRRLRRSLRRLALSGLPSGLKSWALACHGPPGREQRKVAEHGSGRRGNLWITRVAAAWRHTRRLMSRFRWRRARLMIAIRAASYVCSLLFINRPPVTQSG